MHPASAPSPRVFPGRLHPAGRAAIDWGPQGLVAYACVSHVVVINPQAMKVVQTLDEHHGGVITLRWSPEALCGCNSGSYRLSLASGDSHGCIFIWDVIDGSIITQLSQQVQEAGQKVPAVVDIHWVPDQLGYLAAVYYSAYIILWNTQNSTKVWRFDIADSVHAIGFNPFDTSQMLIGTENCSFYVVKDFNTVRPPAPMRTKYRLPGASTAPPASGKKPPPMRMIFSSLIRNAVFFTLERDVLLFDIDVYQLLSSANTSERARSPIMQMLLCDEPDRFITLHEDGAISVFERAAGFSYALLGMAELARFSKQSKRRGAINYAIAFDMFQPNNLAAVTNDGTFWMWRLNSTPAGAEFAITGMLHNLSAGISSLAVLPATEDSSTWKIILGTFAGTIQVVGKQGVECEHLVRHHQPIRGVKFLPSGHVVYHTSEEKEKGLWKNQVMLLDIGNGRSTDVRKGAPEKTFIRGTRVSPFGHYIILLLRDRSPELWNLDTRSLIRTLDPFVDITTLEWCVGLEKGPREQFALTLMDGSVRLFQVESNEVQAVRAGFALPTPFTSAIMWREHLLVCGDTTGALFVTNLLDKRVTSIQTNRGLIRKIRFSDRGRYVLLFFQDGDFGIWDLDHAVRISMSNYLRARDLKTLDVEWVSDTMVVAATNDGALRILDRTLSVKNSRIARAALVGSNKRILSLPSDCCPATLAPSVAWPAKLASLLRVMYPDGDAGAKSAPAQSVVEQYAHLAMRTGSLEEVKFWRIVRDRLQRGPIAVVEHVAEPISPNNFRNAGLPLPLQTDDMLPLSYGVLTDQARLRNLELLRTSTLERQRNSYELTRRNADMQAQAGRHEKAVELLLETPPTHPNFVADSLRACLLAAVVSPTTFRDTMKLVATNFIANGSLDEGVGLLCLAGKTVEACRYLQIYDRWSDAAWLAKTTLSESDSSSVFKRWADSLLPHMPYRALHIYASLGDWPRVVEVLVDNKEVFRAALLFRILAQAGLWHTKALSAKLRAAVRAGLDTDLATLANSASASAAQQLHKEVAAELDAYKEEGEAQAPK